MKKFLIVPLMALCTLQGAAQLMWQGQSTGKRVLIRLAADSLGRPAAFFTLPESWVENVRADSYQLAGNRLVATCKSRGLSFDGTFIRNRDSIRATVIAYNDTMHMTMGRTERLQELYYAQNPRPPYPYKVEQVSYGYPDGSVTFAGTLTIPAGKGPFPAAIIVSGTGKQDRDGAFAGHKPFHRIADYLTRRGIAVLRVDDRGTGESTGVYEDATTRDFYHDALLGIACLKLRPEIDPGRVGVIGHSEGGQVAMMLGGAPDCAVAFVVSLAGVGVSGLEILHLQNEAILAAMPGFTPEKVATTMNLYDQLFRTVYDTPDGIPLDGPLRKSLAEWMAAHTEAERKLADVNDGRDQMFIGRYIYAADRPWYRQSIRYNPEDYVPRIKVPVLALNGNRDLNVPAAENLSSIRRLLEQGGNRNFEVVEIDGLNHMFQHAETGTSQEAGRLDEVFSEEALRIMAGWLRSIF